MKKSLFVLLSCCSFGVVCAQGNGDFVIDIQQDHVIGNRHEVSEVAGDSASFSSSQVTLVQNSETEDDFVDSQSSQVVLEQFPEIEEGPMVPVEDVVLLKAYCSLAYVDPNQLKENPKEFGIEELFYRGGDTSTPRKFAGFVKRVGKTMIVSFPGTRLNNSWGELFSDVHADIRIWGRDGEFLLNRPGVEAHPGFAREVADFFDEMLKKVRKSMSKDVNEIRFTGHSKGGGEAIIAALKFSLYVNGALEEEDKDLSIFRNNNAIKVFTLGAPAVLNDSGVKLFHDVIGDRNAICFYGNMDPVHYSTYIPALWKRDLYHLGIPVNVSCESKKKSDDSEVVDAVLESYNAVINTFRSCWSKRISNNSEEVGATLESHKAEVSAFPKKLLKKALESHNLENFNVKEGMERVKHNYVEKKQIDRNKMGRDDAPTPRLMVFGDNVSSSRSRKKINMGRLYSGSPISKDVRTYIFLCKGIEHQKGLVESLSTDIKNSCCGPSSDQLDDLSIGAVTVDGELDNVNESTSNVVWSAVASFGKIDDCCYKSKPSICFDVAYNPDCYKASCEEFYECNEEFCKCNEEEFKCVHYYNGEIEEFTSDPWWIKDKAEYLHNEMGRTRGKSVIPGSIIQKATYLGCDASTILSKALWKKEYPRALSIGGFLKLLGKSSNREEPYRGKKYKIVSGEDCVDFCESFFTNNKLINQRNVVNKSFRFFRKDKKGDFVNYILSQSDVERKQ